ncbi:TRAP transporter substrate-binding protein [Lacisediminihabitans sp.]|uniref:TRAP transporter substrate-binding protein n=1 Tax=Lacisediminihabitans sp. TaxID=2787631 RepID=UPI00374CABDB
MVSPPPKPLTLRLSTDDGPGEVSSTQITEFARRVAGLSAGSLVVEPAWHVNGGFVHDWDQAAARKVIDGKLPLGLIPSRAWDTLGVTSLQALSTPMLITDESLAAAVVTSPLQPTLLSGLRSVGVTGLSIYPDELRHPFGYEAPMDSLEQFGGAVMRVPTSAASTMLYQALGARTVDDQQDLLTQRGQDSDYGRDPYSISTGNVVWSSNFNVLIVNNASFAALTPSQRAVLRLAAAETQSWAIVNLPTESDAAARWCHAGHSIVAASPDQLAAIQRAVAPVRDTLAKDPTTSTLIEGIEAIKASTGADGPVVACPA